MEMDTDMDILALKDAFWKLTARVALVENFITKKFGTCALRVVRRKYSITTKTTETEDKSKSGGRKTEIDSGNVSSCIRNMSKIHTQSSRKKTSRIAKQVNYNEDDVPFDISESEDTCSVTEVRKEDQSMSLLIPKDEEDDNISSDEPSDNEAITTQRKENIFSPNSGNIKTCDPELLDINCLDTTVINNNQTSEDKDHSKNLSIEPKSKKQMPFVLLLEKYPEILKKSQKPSFLKVKNKAIKEFTSEVHNKLGLQFTKKSLSKKINNMKNTAKKKSISNPTCGLSEWENRFLKLLNDVKSNSLLPQRSGTLNNS